MEVRRGILLERLKLDRLPGCVLIGDLSIMNVYTGISSHSVKCSCYICEGVATLVSGLLRTFGNLITKAIWQLEQVGNHY